ncbi:MAG: CNNM domain-containing protein, partial [Nitrosopumilaceae archaeon]
MTLEINLLVIAILIGFSAFFSGIEVALVSIRKSRVEQLVKQKVRGAKALQKLKSD